MRNKGIILLASICLIPPVYSCPIQEEEKHQMLSELCNIDDGKWESNRLNEMIILAKYEKLPPEGTTKGNRTLAALTCEFGYL